MGRFIAGSDRRQQLFLPECVDDYVAADPPVRIVDVFVDELDLAALGFDEAALTGRPGYNPATMLKLYVYGYLNQVQSSRRLEREAGRNVELMWLTGKRDGLGQINDAVSISGRPASVKDRGVPGHWEGDLISGARGSHVVTLVERQSHYVILAKVADKQTATVVSTLIGQARKLPRELYQSLAWDRGKELADHRRFTLATDVAVYFCDPQSPSQRGTNENINRLLRQYLPHGVDLSTFSQAQLSAIARHLNERPRKTLMYQTPAEKFAHSVASIG